jgi:Chaperone of endosialidase
MPYNGSGTFIRNYNWVNDKNAAIPITASRMDADSNDFANGLSQVVTRDGQGASNSVLRISGIGATPFVGGGMSDSASAYLLLNKAGSAHTDSIFGANNGLTRWQLALGDASPESGANSGSNVALLRYNDAGAVIDTPLTVARNTGLTTVATLAVSNPIAGNLSIGGALSIGGTLDVTGVATFHAQYGVNLTVAAGQIAEYRAVETGGRDFGFGNYGPGNYFRIVDYTANAERLTITATGQVSMGGPLLIGPVSDGCQITAAASGFARYFATVTGANQWGFGCRADGTFSIEDVGAGIRLQIAVSGAVTIPGSLTVSGNIATNQINGTIIIASNYVQVNRPSGNDANLYATVTGVRQWRVGTRSDGLFQVFDDTANALRFYITTAGAGVFVNNLTCSGNFNSNQINGTAIIASTNFQCNVGATNALLYLQNSVRSWYVGNDTSGTFAIADNSAGAYRFSITTAGAVTVYQTLQVNGNCTVSGNFNTNAISCSSLTCSSISNSGPSTLVGTVSCNAIVSATINTQNNIITSGPINANGIVTVVNGVNYSNLGAHTIGFNNSGATLTFFALGGTTASWAFTVSDERLKTNLDHARGDALDEFRRLKLHSFDMPFADGPTKHFDYGFSAQQMQTVIPEAVVEANHARAGEAENLVLTLDIVPLLARCVGAIQQLAQRIETLEGMIVP